MEPVQHADTGHGRGSQIMLDTDIHTAQTARGTRPSALGDLRLAGTVATGLVAGTLGLGALAAPLVGWKGWPSGLQASEQAGTAKLAHPAIAKAPRGKSPVRNGKGAAGTATPLPGGATALAGLTLSTPAGSPALGTGGLAVGGGVGSANERPRVQRRSTNIEVHASPSTDSGQFATPG